MKYIDIEKWPRKEHFKYFKGLDYPHFNLCGNVEVTNYYKYVKAEKLPVFLSILFAVTKTANGITEFKYRIREDKVVEHEKVKPSFTVINEEEVFSFCSVEFYEEFKEFVTEAQSEIEKVKNAVSIEDEEGADDLLFITSIPWVSFTNITHPINMSPVDCVPRISWGKFFEQEGKLLMPISVQAHHGLVDGVHVGKFFTLLQEILNNPEKHL